VERRPLAALLPLREAHRVLHGIPEGGAFRAAGAGPADVADGEPQGAPDRGVGAVALAEDAAQAVGARSRGQCVGALGDIGCLSFYPPTHLGACGDGGALLTNVSDLARRYRMISLHGAEARYRHELPGLNSRLDSLQAAILKVKLPHLEDWIEKRIRIAEAYGRALQPLPTTPPFRAPGVRHVYNQYSIRSPRRDGLAEFLRSSGVDCAIHYPLPLHLQPAYRQWADGNGSFPHAEALAEEILSLPIFPELTREETDQVAATVRDFWKS